MSLIVHGTTGRITIPNFELENLDILAIKPLFHCMADRPEYSFWVMSGFLL